MKPYKKKRVSAKQSLEPSSKLPCLLRTLKEKKIDWGRNRIDTRLMKALVKKDTICKIGVNEVTQV